MKEPNIYFDMTIMSGCVNLTLFCFPRWCLFDIRFSNDANQIVLFNKELYFKYKSNK